MKLTDVFNAQAIGINYTEAASNNIPYLGTGFFPSQKKAGLDLKWFKGHNGLAVSLMPSNFDAKSTFRDRVGIEMNETEMPFFRESMLVKEKDEQEIMRVQDSNDPYATQILNNIFNDTQTLLNGADVVPERMRMQLLAPIGGKVGIEIKANGVNYTYDYDPNGTWKTNHYVKIVGDTDVWTAAETCDPIKNIEDALDKQEETSGNRPTTLLMSKATFNLIKNSKKVRSGVLAQNTTANVNYTSAKIRQYVEEELNVTIVIYNKQFKDETGTAKKFYPDNIIMMLPDGQLGTTWYGTTPEERTLTTSPTANVSIVNTGVAVSVTVTSDPVNTKTTVSEIVLPSFERLNDCFALEVV
ncbi:MAG: major capsid protein [Acutalibacteraceae bacterium]